MYKAANLILDKCLLYCKATCNSILIQDVILYSKDWLHAKTQNGNLKVKETSTQSGPKKQLQWWRGEKIKKNINYASCSIWEFLAAKVVIIIML